MIEIGLVVFAGDAYIQLPITTDCRDKMFATVNTNIMPNQGTEIGKAIDLGIRNHLTRKMIRQYYH